MASSKRKETDRPTDAGAASPATAAATTESANRPVHTISYRNVKAAIWPNPGQDGRTFHSVTLSRSWKDAEGKWHDSQSFDFHDLTTLAKAVSDAHTWIAWTERRQREANAKAEDKVQETSRGKARQPEGSAA